MDDTDDSFQKPLLLLKLLLVYCFLLFLLALNASSTFFFDFGSISPLFLMMGIYYFTLMRPVLMPMPLVFILGLTLDFVTGVPAGLNAFSYLVLVFVLNSQRRFLVGQSWIMLWVGFILACFVVLLIHFLVFAAINGAFPDLVPLLISVSVSALTYPLITVPMAMLTRSIK